MRRPRSRVHSVDGVAESNVRQYRSPGVDMVQRVVVGHGPVLGQDEPNADTPGTTEPMPTRHTASVITGVEYSHPGILRWECAVLPNARLIIIFISPKLVDTKTNKKDKKNLTRKT